MPRPGLVPQHKKLSTRQLKQLANFTDPASILSYLQREKWTIEESIKYLIEIARESQKDATRLAAIRYLNQLVLDAMERSGMLAMATRKIIGDDGEEISFTGHVVSSTLKNQSETQTTMADLLPGRAPAEVEPENEDEEYEPDDPDDPDDTDSAEETEGQTTEDPEDAPSTASTATDSTGLAASKPPEGIGVIRGNFPGISNLRGSTPVGVLGDHLKAAAGPDNG